MRIRVDRSICAGHALCAARAPLVYVLDAEGYCDADGARVPEALQAQARHGAQVCPEGAISLWDDEEPPE
jgi:ferredoxin